MRPKTIQEKVAQLSFASHKTHLVLVSAKRGLKSKPAFIYAFDLFLPLSRFEFIYIWTSVRVI